MKVFALFILALTLLVSPVHARVFSETSGIVVMEAENAQTLSSEWVIESEGYDGFTGQGYIRYTGGDRFNQPTITPETENVWSVRIGTPGFYRVYVRTLKDGPPRDDDPSDDYNDSWFQVPGLPYEKWFTGGQVGSWTFATIIDRGHGNQPYPPTTELSAGEHQIKVTGRSFNHRIDRIVLAHESVSQDDLNFAVFGPESLSDGYFADFRVSQPPSWTYQNALPVLAPASPSYVEGQGLALQLNPAYRTAFGFWLTETDSFTVSGGDMIIVRADLTLPEGHGTTRVRVNTKDLRYFWNAGIERSLDGSESVLMFVQIPYGLPEQELFLAFDLYGEPDRAVDQPIILHEIEVSRVDG